VSKIPHSSKEIIIYYRSPELQHRKLYIFSEATKNKACTFLGPTCFKSHLPIFAVEIAVYDCPENVSSMGKRKRMKKKWNCQGRKLRELRLHNAP